MMAQGILVNQLTGDILFIKNIRQGNYVEQ
jgi:hypothetical protein